MWVCMTAATGSMVARKWQPWRHCAIISLICGSTIGLRPLLIASTLPGLRSTPRTRFPNCARQAAVTVPTYPKPKTLIDWLIRVFYPQEVRITNRATVVYTNIGATMVPKAAVSIEAVVVLPGFFSGLAGPVGGNGTF